MYQNDLEWIVLFWIKQVPYIFLTERATEPKWNKKYTPELSFTPEVFHLKQSIYNTISFYVQIAEIESWVQP